MQVRGPVLDHEDGASVIMRRFRGHERPRRPDLKIIKYDPQMGKPPSQLGLPRPMDDALETSDQRLRHHIR